MKIVAELGTNFHPGKLETLADAAKAAFDCGADLVKVQCFLAGCFAKRRGGRDPARLKPWELRFLNLTDIFAASQLPYVGATIFCPCVAMLGCPQLAFVKTATHEYQWSDLADTVARVSSSDIPLYVSVPRDGCLIQGNYSSPLPITWLYAEPFYPACPDDYDLGRLYHMKRRLFGKIGLSDHTVGKETAQGALTVCPDLAVIEKHFCYDESLRGKCPDAGPWSLSVKDFTGLWNT